MTTETARITIVYYRQVPHVVDTVLCRRALIRRQIQGELTNMMSLAAAARVSRSTASRFFTGRSTSVSATLRICGALGLTFDEVCRPATDEEVAMWRRQREEDDRQRDEAQRERERAKLNGSSG